jgi:molybdopterin converting factor small subunit
MPVKVIIPESFQVAAGGIDEIKTAAGTIGDCLKEAVAKVPALQKLWFTSEGDLSNYVILCLNGESISRSQVDMPVKDGDEIMPLLMIGGGQGGPFLAR